MPETKSNSPHFLTTKEVADLLRVKERKVYDLAAADEIPHRRITGKLLFPAADLEAWMEGEARPGVTSRPDVLAGSHDPLLDWAIRASASGLATLCNGSLDGLEQFRTGTAALAGLHLPGDSGWNVQHVEKAAPANAVLINWAVRKRGLLVAPGAARSIQSVTDLKGKRIARRQPGAGAGILLDQLLRDVGLESHDLAPAGSETHTESDAAAAVAAGEADAALGLEAMARQFKLAFHPLMDEDFDLLIDRRAYFTEPVQRLLTFARTPEFEKKAHVLGGYNLAWTGTVRWLSP